MVLKKILCTLFFEICLLFLDNLGLNLHLRNNAVVQILPLTILDLEMQTSEPWPEHQDQLEAILTTIYAWRTMRRRLAGKPEHTAHGILLPSCSGMLTTR